MYVHTYTVYVKSFKGENFHGLSLKLNNYIGKTFAVENLRQGGTVLCVVSGWCRYSRKNFNGKTFAVSKNPQKPGRFSPSNDLMYKIYTYVHM